MSAPVKATRQFKADFQAVCRHYKCTEKEIEEMKACARNDLANAMISFGLMAKEVAA